MIGNVLIKTTPATEIDCSHIERITGIAIDSAEPDNTQIRYLLSIDYGKWRKYSDGVWSFVNEQDITADSVIAEGNTKEELLNLTETALTAFAGKKINVAVAMSVENNAELPSISKFELIGKNSQIKKEIKYSKVFELAKEAVGVTGIDVSKNESSGGAIEVYASTQNDTGEWSNYVLCDKVTGKAKAIRFKAEMEVDKPAVSTSILNNVKVHHWQSGKSASIEGKSVLVTKPITLDNDVNRAHAIIRHPKIKDTEFKLSVIFGASDIFKEMTCIATYDRGDEIEEEFEFTSTDESTSKTVTLKVEIIQKSGSVTEELLGTGNGKQQAFKLAHHARPETLQVLGSNDWIFKEKTDTLIANTKNGDEILVSYDWIAETSYLTALACVFNS